MGGKVLRRAGAALLAGLLIAAGAARGQTAATDQIEQANSGQTALAPDQNVDLFHFTCTAALIPDGEFGAAAFPCSCDGTENPRAEARCPGVAFRGPEGPRFHQTPVSLAPAFSNLRFDQALLPPTPRFHLLDASLLSSGDSSDAELPSAPAPAVAEDQSAPYTPITGEERLSWIVKNTLWPQHLAGGVITSAVGTALDHPREDGPHWGGFGERFGVRLTGVATSNVMEAGLGALWGEDPRYFAVPEDSFGGRVKNVIKMTFLARRPDGNFAPAYARYMAFAGNNFLSNAWRPDSEADVQHALIRTAEGFAGRMAANAWDEFWPQAKSYIFHHGK